MRLLLPLRSSATRSTGSGLSRRATAWISSGNVEDGIADFVPGYVVLKCVVGVAPEQDLAAGPRHLRMAEDLGEIVDEHVASQRRDATYLLLARAFEEDMLAPQAQPRGIEEALGFHPLQRRNPQVGQRGIVVRALGFVAHDGDSLGMLTTQLQETRSTLEQRGGVDAPAVDQALQCLPQKPVGTFGQQRPLDGRLVALEGGREKPLLLGHPLERLIVTDQRIVEIDADPHVNASPRAAENGRTG